MKNVRVFFSSIECQAGEVVCGRVRNEERYSSTVTRYLVLRLCLFFFWGTELMIWFFCFLYNSLWRTRSAVFLNKAFYVHFVLKFCRFDLNESRWASRLSAIGERGGNERISEVNETRFISCPRNCVQSFWFWVLIRLYLYAIIYSFVFVSLVCRLCFVYQFLFLWRPVRQGNRNHVDLAGGPGRDRGRRGAETDEGWGSGLLVWDMDAVSPLTRVRELPLRVTVELQVQSQQCS